MAGHIKTPEIAIVVEVGLMEGRELATFVKESDWMIAIEAEEKD